jgi:hypothetical protein
MVSLHGVGLGARVALAARELVTAAAAKGRSLAQAAARVVCVARAARPRAAEWQATVPGLAASPINLRRAGLSNRTQRPPTSHHRAASSCEAQVSGVEFRADAHELVEGTSMGRMVRMDSYTLLADATDAGRRTAVLKLDGSWIQVRANVLAADEDLLFVDLWLGGAVKHLGLVFDSRWMLPASTQDHDRQVALDDVRGQLEVLGYPLTLGENRPLLADHVAGKRTSVLKDDDGVWELRAKLLVEDDEQFVHLRLWYTERGYMHFVLRTDGTFVTEVTGGTDKDTWDRMRGELARHGVDVF